MVLGVRPILARNKGGIRFFEEILRVLGDRDGTTYRWVPNLLVNARPAVWLGVSKLIRSRGRAPSARHRLRGHLGHKDTPAGAKMLEKCDFGVNLGLAAIQRPTHVDANKSRATLCAASM